MMILQVDVVSTGQAIGGLAPTALLGIAIVVLVWDRSRLTDKLDNLVKENTALYIAAIGKAETVTQKVADALNATEGAFDKFTTTLNTNTEIIKQIHRHVIK